MADKMQTISSIPTRQKVVGVVFLVVVIIIIWQLVGLFGGGGSAPKPATPTPATTRTATTTTTAATTTTKPVATQPQIPSTSQLTPQPAAVAASQTVTSQRELQLAQLQQETQAKYLAALNDLQMLKIQRDIAEQNQAIMTAKLSAVQSQKKMVDLLAPPAPPASAATIRPITTPQPTPTPVISPLTSLSVISVSLIQGQWNAVINSQGSLYSVKSGDILPVDGSKVLSIDKGGITLIQKDGSRKRISLVPII